MLRFEFQWSYLELKKNSRPILHLYARIPDILLRDLDLMEELYVHS